MRGRWRAAALPLAGMVAAGLAAGCGPRGADRAAAPAADAVATRSGKLHLARARGAPGDTITGHATYEVEWPDPAAIPGTSRLADSVRLAIRWAAAESAADGAGRPLPPDSLAARFLASHARTVREFPHGPREWSIRRRITLETLAFGLVTLRTEDERHEGGAHGMATTIYTSFDPKTGVRLRLADVIDPAGRDSLRAAGERAFRAAHAIAPGADLEAAGFFTGKGGRFELSDNFGVTRAGLVFHWNPYDIAPYSSGPSTITLPWDEVRPHLKADGPLAMGR